MRRPTRLQYFFAEAWLPGILLAAGPVICLAAAVWCSEPSLALLTDWWALLCFLAVVVLSPILGLMGAVLTWFIVLGPLYHVCGLLNGAPFKKGDTVQILAGPNRGTITTVYSTWCGESVRVTLGPRKDDDFRDIFGPAQLLREDTPSMQCSPFSVMKVVCFWLMGLAMIGFLLCRAAQGHLGVSERQFMETACGRLVVWPLSACFLLAFAGLLLASWLGEQE